MFSDANDQPAAAQAAVLSYAAWEVKFGRDKSIVGSTVVIEGCAFRIVGVTQPAFLGNSFPITPLPCGFHWPQNLRFAASYILPSTSPEQIGFGSSVASGHAPI